MSQPQKRIFYACQAVLFISRNTQTSNSPLSEASYLTGVQSVGVDGDFPSTTFPDFGRFQRKNKFENRQKEFSINIDRVLAKGQDTFYNSNYSSSYTTTHLLHEDNIGCQGELNNNGKCLRNYDIFLVYGDDENSLLNDSTTKKNVVYRNCLLTSLSYNISVDGSIIESIGLISRKADYNAAGVPSLPASPQSAETVRRQDIDMASTILPEEALAICKTDEPDSLNNKDIYGLQSINIDMSIDYTELNDIGIWRGYNDGDDINKWRFVNLPINISSSFTGVSRSLYPREDIGVDTPEFEKNKSIKIVSLAGNSNYYIWDLGRRNYLNNINVSGGDADGGNVELTLSYQNDYSELVIARAETVQDITSNAIY